MNDRADGYLSFNEVPAEVRKKEIVACLQSAGKGSEFLEIS